MSGGVLPARDNRWLGLAVAAALHVGLLALLILAPGQAKLPPVGSSVPVNIVSSAPATDTQAAVQAPQTQTAATQTPVPEAKTQTAAPPAPIPSFSRSVTTPAKTKAPTPQPSTHPTTAATPSVDFDRMQAIIDNARHSGGTPTSSAQRGPPRPQTAAQASPDVAHGVSQSDLLGLQQLLGRLWHPNCEVAGGSSVRLKVTFTVTLTGHLLNPPDTGGLENSANEVVAAAARRAAAAVIQAEPYAAPYYGQTITVNFDAKEACAKR